MSVLFTVCRKELLETLRERRTVLSLLFGALFGPVIFTAMMNLVVSRNLTSIDEALEVPILGAEHAPNLVAYLRARNIEPVENHDVDDVNEAARLVANGTYDVVLIIDDAFAKDFGTDHAARVERGGTRRQVGHDAAVFDADVAGLAVYAVRRIVDGATAAHFMNELVRLLETPALLLLEG